jgi:hypothetical protein
MTTEGQFYIRQKVKGAPGAAPVDLQDIENKLDSSTFGLGALKELMEAIEAKLDDGTTGLAALKALIDALEVKVDEVEAKLDAALTSQLCPIMMNCEQTLTTVAGNKDFIASNSPDGIPVGIAAASVDKVKRVVILMVGRAVNTYNGQNNLDCTTATHNQWQINIDGGAYVDLQNAAKADGQMHDTDWECIGQGVTHPFTLSFDITDLITSLTNRIGVRLQNGRSLRDSLIVTLDIYLKVMWGL